MIEIEHNFDPRKFKWLWARYVQGINDRYHCTNCLRGPYSKRFSKNNPAFHAGVRLLMDEVLSYQAIYICGVSPRDYTKHLNYPYNVHAAIIPSPGTRAEWSFENWTMSITNGNLGRIPQSVDEIPRQYRGLPPEFTTCRIFRWAVTSTDVQSA